MSYYVPKFTSQDHWWACMLQENNNHDCISLPCEQPLEKSDLMPCDTMDTGAGSSPQDSRPGGRECQQQWDVRRSPGKISLSNSWHGEDNPTFAFSWENIFLFLRCHMEVNWKKKSKN
nr:uncharacterized protein LOC106838971 isoform X16 [Equus asinus]